MNTLTKNRIIEKGDEFLDGDKWKLVPKDDIGLQIMFSKYAQVRRPSEKPFKPSSNGESRNAGQSDKIATPRKAETTPVPTSGAGDTAPTVKLAQSEREIEANGLPTVVSRKAHVKAALPAEPYTPAQVATIPCTYDPTGARTRAVRTIAPPAPPKKPVPATVTITYPDKGPDCIWTGRNGTFKARAVRLENLGSIIRIVPKGKRGIARNAVIEFPAACIEQIRLALNSMTP